MAEAGENPRKLEIDKEMRRLQGRPLYTLTDATIEVYYVKEEQYSKWQVIVQGPPQSIYMDGNFHAELHFPENYPEEPPTFVFVHKLTHPNVDPNTLRMHIPRLQRKGDTMVSNWADFPVLSQPCQMRWDADRPANSVRMTLLSVFQQLEEPLHSGEWVMDYQAAIHCKNRWYGYPPGFPRKEYWPATSYSWDKIYSETIRAEVDSANTKYQATNTSEWIKLSVTPYLNF